jgi:hypothetical protein
MTQNNEKLQESHHFMKNFFYCVTKIQNSAQLKLEVTRELISITKHKLVVINSR